MTIKVNPKRWFQLGALAMVFAMSPFVFTTEGTVQVQEALCEETGSCCPEEDSICIGVGYYYILEGACP